MQMSTLPTTVAQTFFPVKPSNNSQLPLFPDSMIHHKVTLPRIVGNSLVDIVERGKPYGVSSYYKVLTQGVLNKHFDQIVHCLRDVIGLPTSEREATLALLRFGAYYGDVYPKASQCCSEPGCSKATFWRAVKHLKDLGLIRTIPRFLIREHAQISNLYLLHKLLLVIPRYLAEHGVAF